MKSRCRCLGLISWIVMFSTHSFADNLGELSMRAQEAAHVVRAIDYMPEMAIPVALMEESTCVATFPSVTRQGLVFGVTFGEGLVSCRIAGGWSSPSFIQINGASFGPQIGIQSVDLVLVYTRANAKRKLSHSHQNIGLNTTWAVGPLGRYSHSGNDYRGKSEIYAYSQAKGLFVGWSLEGAKISIQRRNNAKVYGDLSTYDILSSDESISLSGVSSYVDALNRY